MFDINEYGNIIMTKGDSGCFSVLTLQGKHCKPVLYDIQPEDILHFTVRNIYTDEIALSKDITGANTFYFVPSDTQNLKVGKYKYDVQLDCSRGIYTVIPTNTFIIDGEVTYA